ncbi:endonuclease domain-containing protein [Sphingomonas immobilis]|uniref:Endonuclease domain-containing protein n=1 Tax=Sphingomonas immobilis TaxID=3063997 RepID=A0ABT9A482_9SPHN|nr:endonuclease domain-containing protein [Sphingomonas sp. CA1-15]MDO7844025.1 endonuclease domain-containing protein [Sphingomonas sp. CA1-15]
MPPRKTVEKARCLRRQLTPPEVKLWQWLRERPGGLKFRRQHPIGPYVLDFYHAATKLAIEVDGEAHDRGERPERDGARDAWLAEQGLRTLRIPATDVMREFDAVTRMILAECGTFPLHQPSAGPPPHAAHGEER